VGAFPAVEAAGVTRGRAASFGQRNDVIGIRRANRSRRCEHRAEKLKAARGRAEERVALRYGLTGFARIRLLGRIDETFSFEY
jgi:hypothetical protein